MALLRNLLGTSPSGGDASNVEDVFSTYLYTSPNDSSTFSVNNGIDLDGEGGMVWLKSRNYNGGEHLVFDTERPNRYPLRTNGNLAEDTGFPQSNFTFSSTGFGITDGYGWDLSYGGKDYTSWTFRKAPRFFDVVTYTGNGVAGREIAHNLGCDVGFMVVKRTDSSGDWVGFHRSLGGTKWIPLQETTQALTYSGYWEDTAPTDSVFTIGGVNNVNASGGTFVAYLFAHDPVGEDNDGMIACGSYTGNGSTTGPVIDLGWEPQYVLIKKSSGARDWLIFDTMRGITTGGVDPFLAANASYAEESTARIALNSTGFTVDTTSDDVNTSGSTFIYMAIRAPMMVEPESATEVFATITYTGDGSANRKINTGFNVDASIIWGRTGMPACLGARLFDGMHEVSETAVIYDNLNLWIDYDSNDGITYPTSYYYSNNGGSAFVSHFFKRAKGFFDVVAYDGDGSGPGGEATTWRAVPHSLGVTPGMIWNKIRNSSGAWRVWHTDAVSDGVLNQNNGPWGAGYFWNAEMSPTHYSLGAGTGVNRGGDNYISYLFASLDGVSKCGSYTGSSSGAVDVDCGFSNGARFVIIKRIDGVGDWYLYDTERGITTGDDPYLLLNTQDPESTNTNNINPYSAGFTLTQQGLNPISTNGATYIFFAVA
jgi:hypothetical protein